MKIVTLEFNLILGPLPLTIISCNVTMTNYEKFLSLLILLKLARQSLKLSCGVLSGSVGCQAGKMQLQLVCCALTILIGSLLISKRATVAVRQRFRGARKEHDGWYRRGAHKECDGWYRGKCVKSADELAHVPDVYTSIFTSFNLLFHCFGSLLCLYFIN